jgi:DivIVA domain-containing protein
VLLVPSRIRSMSFGLAPRGYNPRQVDDVLHQIATALERRGPVDPGQFVAAFQDVASGYRAEEVDEYLAAVLAELKRRADVAAIVATQRGGSTDSDDSPPRVS